MLGLHEVISEQRPDNNSTQSFVYTQRTQNSLRSENSPKRENAPIKYIHYKSYLFLSNSLDILHEFANLIVESLLSFLLKLLEFGVVVGLGSNNSPGDGLSEVRVGTGKREVVRKKDGEMFQ